MTEKPDLEWQKREVAATIDEIAKGESAFKERHGIDLADEDEWQQIGEFVSRIEQRWKQKLAAKRTEEDAA